MDYGVLDIHNGDEGGDVDSEWGSPLSAQGGPSRPSLLSLEDRLVRDSRRSNSFKKINRVRTVARFLGLRGSRRVGQGPSSQCSLVDRSAPSPWSSA